MPNISGPTRTVSLSALAIIFVAIGFFCPIAETFDMFEYIEGKHILFNTSICKGIKKRQLYNISYDFTFDSRTGDTYVSLLADSSSEHWPIRGRMRFFKLNEENQYLPVMTSNFKDIHEVLLRPNDKFLYTTFLFNVYGDTVKMKKHLEFYNVTANKLHEYLFNNKIIPGTFKIQGNYFTDNDNILCFSYYMRALKQGDVKDYLKQFNNQVFKWHFNINAN